MSRVEYILGLWQPPSGHSVGINTVQKAQDCVLSGGRDGRICGWHPNRPDPILQYDAHTDWVNGLYELNNQIWSCSSDTTVKCFSNNQLFTMGAHDDYAKCLAGTSECVYSAGLDGQIISWSLDGQKQSSVRVAGDMGSVYSLAACGNLFASGGPDSIVRLWDSRQPQEARNFHGHGDNVRALLMNDEWIVSGSSDASVRLWNIRSGRTFKTWDTYSDSVYSLFSNDNLQSWYSGDRQGKVHWTSREGKNVLVSEQPNPVEGVVEHNGIWTSGHYLRYWDDVHKESTGSPSPTSTPASNEPSMIIAPHDSLLKTMMLNDKRRVIVAATTGQTALIDIIRGTVVEKLPPVDTKNISESLSDLAEQYNTQDVLDNWCGVGIRAGRLVINLEERSAGCTEVYADEFGPAMGLDLGKCDDERRINLGKLTIQALFANFAAVEQPRVEQLRARQAHTAKIQEKEAQETEQPKKEKSKLSRMFSLRRSSRNTEEKSGSPSASAGNAAAAASAKPEKRETYADAVDAAAENSESVDLPTFKLPDDTRVLISKCEPGQGAATAVFDSMAADIGSERNVEQLRKLLPGWVGEALWLPKMSSRAPARIGFNMVPIDDSHPEILQNKGRLLANPVLRARKAMAYVIASLKEGGHLMDAEGQPDDHIELYCQDELVPPLMTLAMIRTRMWRSGGDVLLKYKFKTAPDAAASQPAAAHNAGA